MKNGLLILLALIVAVYAYFNWYAKKNGKTVMSLLGLQSETASTDVQNMAPEDLAIFNAQNAELKKRYANKPASMIIDLQKTNGTLAEIEKEFDVAEKQANAIGGEVAWSPSTGFVPVSTEQAIGISAGAVTVGQVLDGDGDGDGGYSSPAPVYDPGQAGGGYDAGYSGGFGTGDSYGW